MIEKYKIWDNQNKKWYRPIYPDARGNKTTEEILFSQSGETYIKTIDKDGALSLIHIIQGEGCRFVPCTYTGIKDVNGKKSYLNDEVIFDSMPGFIVWRDGSFCIQCQDSHYPLSSSLEFEITGNILEK